MSQPETVLDYCKHCGDKQNLEILADIGKQVDWLPPDEELEGLTDRELHELGSFPFSVFRWRLLFCPRCNNVSLIQKQAYSEYIEVYDDEYGNPVQKPYWETETLYPVDIQELTDLVDRIKDQDICSSVKLGIRELVPEHVADGLFKLGRAFDVMSKRYFVALARKGDISFRSGQVLSEADAEQKQLNDRINLLVSNRHLTDKEILIKLKDERNDPSHEIHSKEEKREMMIMAKYYARAYLDYIILFQERIDSLMG